MNRLERHFSPDELMAFVDGELPDNEISNVTEHLKTCLECERVITDARQLSGQLASWKVGEPTKRLDEQVLQHLRQMPDGGPVGALRLGWWTRHRFWAYGLGTAFAAVLLVVITAPLLLRSRQAAQGDMFVPPPAAFEQQTQGQQGTLAVPSAVMVIRTMTLTLIAKEFDTARLTIDAVVKQSQGYIDQLTVRGDAGSVRQLSATLRLPASQVDLGLSELKKLGRLISESQNSADITSQYVDLSARLSNARNSEQRLLRLLTERAGDLKEVIEMEREIASVRENIERMDAQRKDLDNKVQFATIQLELTEEYRAELDVPVPSTGSQLRNALVDGVRSAGGSALDIALFVCRYVPVLLIWLTALSPLALLWWRRK